MSSWTYAKAGLDLSKHWEMHRYARQLAEEIARELGIEVRESGGYATSIRVGDLELCLHIDGVGTKTLVLEKLGKLEVAGWDCVAMNVNDVACGGFRPVALVDYVALPSDDVETFSKVMHGVAAAARESRVVILGGETAVLRDLASGVDAACAVLGTKIRKDFENRARDGDLVIGVESWGLHANGYTLVRRVLESRGIGYRSVVEGVDLGEELCKPTAIYSNLLVDAIRRGLLTSAAHITGGAFTKVRRVLGSELDAELSMPEPPPIFKVVQELGRIPTSEMYRVFNMGVGLVLTAPPASVEELGKLIESYGFRWWVLGRVFRGSGRVLLKTFDGERIEF